MADLEQVIQADSQKSAERAKKMGWGKTSVDLVPAAPTETRPHV